MVGEYPLLVTYWANGVIDGYGKRTFAAPQLIYVRWEDSIDLKLTKGSELIVCAGMVSVQQVMAAGEYLAKGDQTAISDPTTYDTAYLIYTYQESPSVDGQEFNRKALLAPRT